MRIPLIPSVFVSYNPKSEFEQTLAIRLHTVGAVNGLNMILPDRTHNGYGVSPETGSRILFADFFMVFSTGNLHPTVQQEINIAFSKHHDRSKILAVYDKKSGKTIRPVDNCTQIIIDSREDALSMVTDFTKKLPPLQAKNNKGNILSLSGFLLIALGLFALNDAFVEERQASWWTAKRKPVKRRKTS